MRDFHNAAKKAAEDQNMPVLYQIASSYALWRKANDEPFPGADDEMAEIIKLSTATSQGVLQ